MQRSTSTYYYLKLKKKTYFKIKTLDIHYSVNILLHERVNSVLYFSIDKLTTRDNVYSLFALLITLLTNK